MFEKAAGVRGEYVLMAKGVLRRRESVNKEIKTGEVEIEVTDLRVLAKSETRRSVTSISTSPVLISLFTDSPRLRRHPSP